MPGAPLGGGGAGWLTWRRLAGGSARLRTRGWSNSHLAGRPDRCAPGRSHGGSRGRLAWRCPHCPLRVRPSGRSARLVGTPWPLCRRCGWSRPPGPLNSRLAHGAWPARAPCCRAAHVAQSRGAAWRLADVGIVRLALGSRRLGRPLAGRVAGLLMWLPWRVARRPADVHARTARREVGPLGGCRPGPFNSRLAPEAMERPLAGRAAGPPARRRVAAWPGVLRTHGSFNPRLARAARRRLPVCRTSGGRSSGRPWPAARHPAEPYARTARPAAPLRPGDRRGHPLNRCASAASGPLPPKSSPPGRSPPPGPCQGGGRGSGRSRLGLVRGGRSGSGRGSGPGGSGRGSGP